jgi:hypothetical protein
LTRLANGPGLVLGRRPSGKPSIRENLVGATAKRSHIFKKEKHGHYVEPAWCSRRLFEVEKFKGPIYDPACGWGTILEESMIAGYAAPLASDIVDCRRVIEIRFYKRDFLTWRGRIRGSVVCNPPFDYVREFCEHALELGASKVAMICLVRRLNAARWLQDLPLRRIWLLTPRPSMPPGSYLLAGKKAGGGTQDFCWLVFGPGTGAPTIGWLHREGEQHASAQ